MHSTETDQELREFEIRYGDFKLDYVNSGLKAMLFKQDLDKNE